MYELKDVQLTMTKTLMAGVPAIYEIIRFVPIVWRKGVIPDAHHRKGMVKKIHEAGPIVGTIFSLAVIGKQTLPWPFSAVLDKVLFRRIKQATGGRLRYAVSGGESHFDRQRNVPPTNQMRRRSSQQRDATLLIDRLSPYHGWIWVDGDLWDDFDSHA